MLLAAHHDAILGSMRTTVRLDPDVAAAVDRLRRERAIGLSEAVNELVRTGLRAKRRGEKFRQRTEELGLRVDVSNIAEVLETLEGPAHR